MAADAKEMKDVTESVRSGPAEICKVVVLVGMRGAGKTSLGKMAAEESKREFVDLDEVLEKTVFKCSINEYVAEHGWPKFREAEAQVLKDALLHGKHGAGLKNGAIVATGGGVIETPMAMNILKDFFPVIWVNRHIDDISSYLETSGAWRPSLGEPPRDVHARRRGLYEECSDYTFTVCKGDNNQSDSEKDFVSCVRWAAGVPSALQLVPDTFISSLTLPTVEEAIASPGTLSNLTKGIDVLEIRADLMKSPSDQAWLSEELALLRRHVVTPICFTLRSVAHGGSFDGSPEQTLQLLKLALKAGCEMIEVDADRFSKEQIEELMTAKRNAKLVGSHHSPSRSSALPEFEQSLRMLTSKGEWDLLKMVQKAASVSSVMELHCCASKVLQGRHKLVLILQGAEGKLSRVLNNVLTPVTHQATSSAQASGEMTKQELIQCRTTLSLLEPSKSFYIFGNPVALSASPTMQNVGFKENGKPHLYGRFETPSIEEVAWKLSLTSCGGGSVSIPHKETLFPYMDEVSDSAREIGAINTVTKDFATDRLHGDNTDWIGIKNQLLPKTAPRGGEQVGLIVGAGGTARAAAYAFRSMGLKQIFVMNRTYERAVAIVKDFGDGFVAVKDVAGLGELARLDVVMGTLPGQANFTLPQELLEKHKPVVIEAAYRSSTTGSRFTALLEQSVQAGCEIVEGLEMLFEQGCAQCEIWTGKSAPRKQIAQALLADRFADDPNPPKNLVHEASLESRKMFYIFGHPVALSASPTMQNVGFKQNGKPHLYERFDTPSIEEVVAKLSSASTGGGSVTIPHKEALFPYMDEVSESARAIGAINTVTKDATNRLCGDNTDWIGIKEQLLPKTKPRGGEQVGLIVGAGGTARAAAYAFRSMGMKQIFVMNRTHERAVAIVKDFGDGFVAVKDVAGLGELARLDVVMGTLPGQANFTLPQELLEKHKPVVIEASYRSSTSGSRFTALLEQSVLAGCEVIEGMEMLFEQGCAQCEIWTGKSAPRKQIAQALLADRFADDPNPPKNLAYEANKV